MRRRLPCPQRPKNGKSAVQVALHGAFPLGKMKMGERKKRIGRIGIWKRRSGCPQPVGSGKSGYFVLSLARSKVTVSCSVSPLRETVSVALSPAE